MSQDFAALSDAEIASLLIAGDIAVFAHVYDLYAANAHALAYRLTCDAQTAEDVVQEVMLALWEHPDGYDPTRGSMRTWLLSAVHHRSVDRIRKQTSRPAVSLDMSLHYDVDTSLLAIEDPIKHYSPDPLDEVVRIEAQAAVSSALLALPESQQTVVRLAYFDGMSQQQIALLLHEPLGTIKTRFRLAFLKLRQSLRLFGEPPLTSLRPTNSNADIVQRLKTPQQQPEQQHTPKELPYAK